MADRVCEHVAWKERSEVMQLQAPPHFALRARKLEKVQVVIVAKGQTMRQSSGIN